jgi:hypothetical protein
MQNVAFLPTASGASGGSVAFGGTGIVPQSILLTGTAVQTATTVTLASNMAMPFAGQAITFTATVKPTGFGTPTGTMSFYDGTTPIGSSVLAAGSASATTTLAAGAHTITAVYAGNANFTGNTSAALAPSVLDFNLTLGTTASGSQTVVPGQPVTYALNLLPVGGAVTFPITLSATGLPPGATATFTPQVITIGAGSASVAMTIQTAASGASLHRRNLFGASYGGGMLALGLAAAVLPLDAQQNSRHAAADVVRGIDSWSRSHWWSLGLRRRQRLLRTASAELHHQRYRHSDRGGRSHSATFDRCHHVDLAVIGFQPRVHS